jgi:sortase A
VPKDWRWAVSIFGRILIAAGLLLFAFVGYQLWGTGIEERQSQSALADDFAGLVADLGTTVPTTSTTVPESPTTPGTTPGTTQPPVPVRQELPPINDGDAVAVIRMPTIDVDKIVVAGVAPEDLKKGPGHFATTPLPGQLGNAGIAGHRTTYGAPFFRVDELGVGDPIEVITPFGEYLYRVTGQQIVGADAGWVIATTDPLKATLTLVSCHPRYTTRERIIISAELETASSSAVGLPLYRYRPIGEEPEPTAPPETLPGEDTSVTTSTTSTTSPATGSEGDPFVDCCDDSTPGASVEEAFGQGWFSDDAAWPHIALWGFALTAISIGATLISRRFRNNWIGFAAGVVPFLAALYFWFQNVNRMLPPSL